MEENEMKTIIVVPWHKSDQIELFTTAWGVSLNDKRFVFQQDHDRSGCAIAKNRGIRKAIEQKAEAVIILDDDCFPLGKQTIDDLISDHEKALQPQPVVMFESVTDPPSRGTTYFDRTILMPVAASMGFWTEVGDYDAPSQLVRGARSPMQFRREAIFGRYFPLCGMNLAFRVSEWPWCQFINVPRFDDIWQGFLWQKKAYAHGQCFNLSGPVVRHSRQSNVWQNLKDEALNLERNESIWRQIHAADHTSHAKLLNDLGLTVHEKCQSATPD